MSLTVSLADVKPDIKSKAMLPENRLFAPSDFGYRMPSGSLELELRHQDSSSSQEQESIPSSVFGFLRYPQGVALGQARESENYKKGWKGTPALEKMSSSSSLSCLEGFMFPEEDHDLRGELIQGRWRHSCLLCSRVYSLEPSSKFSVNLRTFGIAFKIYLCNLNSTHHLPLPFLYPS